MKGYVYKRCKCPVVRDDAGRRVTCPKTHGSWCWVADVPLTDGQPRRQQTRAGYKTKREAEQGLREYLALVDRGQVAPPAQTTLAQYLEQWLDQVEPTLARTASSNYRILLRNYVVPHLGERRLTKLEPRGVVLLYRLLLERGGRVGRPLSPTTVRTVHRVLHEALEDAVEQGALGRDPLARVTPPKAVKRELQVWTREQVQQFLASAAPDRAYPAWLLALTCGLRRGERTSWTVQHGRSAHGSRCAGTSREHSPATPPSQGVPQDEGWCPAAQAVPALDGAVAGGSRNSRRLPCGSWA